MSDPQMNEMLSQILKTRLDTQEKLILKAWQDETFKQNLINNPKAVIAQELGQSGELPEDLTIEVIEENSNKIYILLPAKPAVADMGEEGELSEEALEAVAGGGCVGWSTFRACFAWSAVSKAK